VVKKTSASEGGRYRAVDVTRTEKYNRRKTDKNQRKTRPHKTEDGAPRIVLADYAWATRPQVDCWDFVYAGGCLDEVECEVM